ncbi:DRTGG domain-containing protein [Fusibacter tunisiensis]|uniref:Transcriptional regulator n=1 Tax=Fusibacter tunisiensis TaxID=1008308 RepID=A0ABS2MRD6_9FIRM|nr:DRTGG domain-containing protein [Fusibacter tunisiensis]MBM7561949.1 putative transcriptional regulator [Fusibacter tunisiensis]
MQIKNIAEIIKADVIAYETGIEHEVHVAFGSDLMSDVLAYVEGDTLLITGLVNHQVIRTAEMLDIKVILFVRGKRPTEDVIALANEKKITLMVTQKPMFTVSGLLYQEGLRGIEL